MIDLVIGSSDLRPYVVDTQIKKVEELETGYFHCAPTSSCPIASAANQHVFAQQAPELEFSVTLSQKLF